MGDIRERVQCFVHIDMSVVEKTMGLIFLVRVNDVPHQLEKVPFL